MCTHHDLHTTTETTTTLTGPQLTIPAALQTNYEIDPPPRLVVYPLRHAGVHPALPPSRLASRVIVGDDRDVPLASKGVERQYVIGE